MYVNMRSLALLACAFALTGCFREDEKITLPPPGDAQLAQVNMGSTYDNQIFFSLRNGVVLTNNHAAWDLAFESSAPGYHVWLNGGKDMLAAETYTNSLESFTSVNNGLSWRWDESSWNPDSTAIGNWVGGGTTTASLAPASAMRTDDNEVYSTGRVYIIDRGLTYAAADRYWKVVFVWYSATAYKLKFGKLDNSYMDSIVLEKNPAETYTYFTFDNGGKSIVMEPAPNQWDFVFTRYRYIFYNTTPYTPYLVSGVLLNPQGIAAGLDSTKAFAEADVAFAQQLPLSTQRDEIGFNWKAYNFTTSAYETKQHFTYIIRDREGYYWKLRFLDFYSDQGEKGSPKFEYRRL